MKDKLGLLGIIRIIHVIILGKHQRLRLLLYYKTNNLTNKLPLLINYKEPLKTS